VKRALVAYRRVRAAILHGELAPGHVLSQVAMAAEFGTSRTPLREGLRLLEGEGLVESAPHKRVRVAPLSPEDLEQLYVLRVTLEAEALRLSVDRFASEGLARLDGCLAEMAHYVQTTDHGRWAVAHASFHRLLTASAGDRVNRLLGELFDHSERYRTLVIGIAPGSWGSDSHLGLVQACQTRERDRAAGLLASHLARTGLRTVELLDPDYDAASLKLAVVDAGGQIIDMSALPKRPGQQA
jgi:DNA-binding GntR family transcriptional regulator